MCRTSKVLSLSPSQADERKARFREWYQPAILSGPESTGKVYGRSEKRPVKPPVNCLCLLGPLFTGAEIKTDFREGKIESV